MSRSKTKTQKKKQKIGLQRFSTPVPGPKKKPDNTHAHKNRTGRESNREATEKQRREPETRRNRERATSATRKAQPGTSTEKKQKIGEFYQQLFGWHCLEIEIVEQKALLLMIDEEVSQFILCAESPNPINAPGYDHLGFLFETRDEVDALLAKCKVLQRTILKFRSRSMRTF